MGEGGGIISRREAEELAGIALGFLRERDQLSLSVARIAGILDELGYGEAVGSVSTIDWLRHEGQLGFQAAADLVAVGRQMDCLEPAVEAVNQGEIGFQHLVQLARTKQALGAKPLDQERLLEEAKQVSVGRFWHLCQQARHAADAAGVAQEQAEAVEQRQLRINQQQDGMLTVSGLLDPVGGAALRSALEPLARKAEPEDQRPRARRLADALVELAQHALDQSPPSQRPHLNVTATLGTVLQVPGSPSAEVDYGLPLSQVTVGRLACDCSITRHIFDTKGVLLELGRSKRVVSPQLRKALQRRDRHCSWPGCSRPSSWCEAHHVLPWMRGGATDLKNLVLLCTRHHWQVHEGRWQLFLQPDGQVRVLRPPLDFLAPARAPDSAAAA